MLYIIINVAAGCHTGFGINGGKRGRKACHKLGGGVWGNCLIRWSEVYFGELWGCLCTYIPLKRVQSVHLFIRTGWGTEEALSLYSLSPQDHTYHTVAAPLTSATDSEPSHQDHLPAKGGVVTRRGVREDRRSSSTRGEVCRETIGQVSATVWLGETTLDPWADNLCRWD